MEESKKMGENVDVKIPLLCSPNKETPVRAIVCLKRKEDMKRFEETEECFILDFDPFESLEFSKLSLDNKDNPANASTTLNHDDDDADLSVVAEKGPVACRDYPHSRHLCLKFPFSKTPHESYCEMCYCYVCDSTAPCKYWTQPLASHCDADSADYWKEQRNMNKLAFAEKAHY